MNIDSVIESMFEARKHELFFYSSYSFLRNVPAESLYVNTVKNALLKKINDHSIAVVKIDIGRKFFLFLVEHLQWDSDFFNLPTYRLHTVLYNPADVRFLNYAVSKFKEISLRNDKVYYFTLIPSEDIYLLQALTATGFNLIETRMTFYWNLNNHKHERFSVRAATYDDIPNLRKVASEMRNPFDRFHADPNFSINRADEFLATFIENSVKGFADYTIVPNEPGTPPDAFLTAKFLKDEWPLIGAKVSKMVLAAVSAKTCKGWYKKLISEMAYYLKDQGADYVFMHPATTNRAGINTFEYFGGKIGQVSHVLSIGK